MEIKIDRRFCHLCGEFLGDEKRRTKIIHDFCFHYGYLKGQCRDSMELVYKLLNDVMEPESDL